MRYRYLYNSFRDVIFLILKFNFLIQLTSDDYDEMGLRNFFSTLPKVLIIFYQFYSVNFFIEVSNDHFLFPKYEFKSKTIWFNLVDL